MRIRVVGSSICLTMTQPRLTGGAILQKLVEQKTISPAGLSWLTLAVDPWHDNAVTGFSGLPDQGIGKSVTFQVVQEYSISKGNAPGGLPAGNWSCRIGNFPFLQDQIVATGNYYGSVVTQDNLTSQLLKGVQVNYAADGVDFADVATNGTGNAQGTALPVEYTKGIVKLCGMGIEVINTTSQLNKQGLMSCARMVQPELNAFAGYLSYSNPANQYAVQNMTPVRTLPKNLTELALYPGFMQDEAQFGYYAPVLLKFGQERHYPIPSSVLLLDDDPAAGKFDPTLPIKAYTTRVLPVSVPGNTTVFYTSNEHPLFVGVDSNVVMFTGLSDETTLTLRVRYIMERFPSDAEGQILVIATPSATYDPAVLQLYSQAVQQLPAGCRFTDNPSGEWWKSMLTEIGKVASPLLKMLPHPLAQGLARAVDAGTLMLGEGDENRRLASEVRKAQQAKRQLEAASKQAKQIAGPAKPIVSNNKGSVPAVGAPAKKKKRNKNKK